MSAIKAPAIVTVSFGDKAAIARTLTGKGAELKASILEAALIPMVSNLLAGHGTFSKIINGKGHNEACPLQSAVSALKGRAKLARDEAFAIAKEAGKAADQAAHDETITAVTLAIMGAVTPAPRATSERTDWKAAAEAAEAKAAALAIDLAEAQAALAEAQAALAAMAPANANASEAAPAIA